MVPGISHRTEEAHLIIEHVKKPASPKEIEAQDKRQFSDEDRAILAGYEPVANLIAATFGPGCEVLIHSAEDLAHSVLKIINGKVTGRSVGSPVTELGLQILSGAVKSQGDIVGPYFCRSKAGKLLKSTNLILRNRAKVPIGFLGVNFDLDLPLSQFLEGFFPSAEDLKADEDFAADLGSLVAKAVAEELEEMSRITGVSPTVRNRHIAADLEKRGVFEIKGSVELVAGELGLTKHTIYKYLRELRAD
ncbi:MAG: PAS domain-containing protein [Spirochaetes bacterium]|nr:PAS domain-containing protein [Spirochaetota bacterium]